MLNIRFGPGIENCVDDRGYHEKGIVSYCSVAATKSKGLEGERKMV